MEQAEQGSPCALVDTNGVARGEIEVGESVLVRCDGLAAASDYRFVVRENGKEVLSAALVSDGKGVIEPALLWPDVGLGRSKTELFSFQTLEDAHDALAGRQFVVEVWDGKTAVATTPLAIATKLAGARIEPTDESGAPHRGLRSDEPLWIALRNQPAGEVDLVLVAAQADWYEGDRIAAALDDDGRPIVQRIKLDGKPLVTTLLAKAPPAGEYQLLVLPADNPYGDLRVYDPFRDHLSDRLLATVVIRRDLIDLYPFVFGTDIAGRRLAAAPHFQFLDNFALGMPVDGALDPGPDGGARKVRFYVIPHRTPADWRTSTALADITGHVVELVLRADGIAGNRVTLWPDAVAGDYDVIADFGNGADDPAAFVADARFDSGRDVIDGYARVGFRVTADPSRPGTLAIASTSYADGSFELIDAGHPSGNATQPMHADVRYPVGSAAQPLVVVLHGQMLPYDGYGYLLDQLASQGFVAASVDCGMIPGWADHPIEMYGDCLFEYLARLRAKNTEAGPLLGRIDLSRIAIIGHSRGGDAVALAEQRNRSEARGWAIRAVASIAPTDGGRATVEVPYLCLYGSNDGDVGRFGGFPYSVSGTGFTIYDRARAAKAMVFVRDANHNYFNGLKPSEHASYPATIELPRADHETIARGYLTAFLQWQLLGRTEQRDYFANTLPLPGLSGVFIRHQYAAAPAGIHLVDDFAGSDVFHNRLGGAVGFGDLDSYLVGSLGLLERSAPHAQRGLKLRWNATAPRAPSYVTNLPTTARDLRGYRTLSFRVGQTYGYMGWAPSEYGTPVVTYASELDRRVVSTRLVADLATYAHVTVSTSAAVTVVTAGTRWRLDAGGDNVYTLERVLQAPVGRPTYYNLRVWRAGAEANRRGRDQDVTVRLTASDGTSRVIRTSALTRIAYPDHPVIHPDDSEMDYPRTLASLQTVRIPLSAWTLDYPGADVVDLSGVASITLGFPNASGELLVDDIAFDRD